MFLYILRLRSRERRPPGQPGGETSRLHSGTTLLLAGTPRLERCVHHIPSEVQTAAACASLPVAFYVGLAAVPICLHPPPRPAGSHDAAEHVPRACTRPECLRRRPLGVRRYVPAELEVRRLGPWALAARVRALRPWTGRSRAPGRLCFYCWCGLFVRLTIALMGAMFRSVLHHQADSLICNRTGDNQPTCSDCRSSRSPSPARGSHIFKNKPVLGASLTAPARRPPFLSAPPPPA